IAVRPLVIAQRRAAGLDRIVEHRLDAVDQPLGAFVRRAGLARDGRCKALGREQRAMQRLADVNVTEPGYHALIRERRLETRLLALAGRSQHRGIEGVAERLRPEPAE